MTEQQKLSTLIKRRAEELGFSACGIAKAEAVNADVRKGFEEWIASGAHGEMGYMARNLEKRMDPTLLVEGCRSIIVVAQNYFPATASPQISRYAQGKDYHSVVKDKLFKLLEFTNSIVPIKGRAYSNAIGLCRRDWERVAGTGSL